MKGVIEIRGLFFFNRRAFFFFFLCFFVKHCDFLSTYGVTPTRAIKMLYFISYQIISKKTRGWKKFFHVKRVYFGRFREKLLKTVVRKGRYGYEKQTCRERRQKKETTFPLYSACLSRGGGKRIFWRGRRYGACHFSPLLP